MSIPAPVRELRVTRPGNGLRPQRNGRYESGDATYRAWVGHTQHCPTCRAGVSCATAVRLGRAWREARRG